MNQCRSSSIQLTVPTLVLLLTLWPPTEVVAQTGHDGHDHHDEAVEEVIVQATRSRQRVQDAPIRVEVLAGEEIEEKLLMRPGNISMMLNETGGLRVQVTSPALGSANVRIHGMRGRYTQLLADGLPLYGGQAASLGLLQVPPSDLGQVEVIKGSSSALYGGQALGGVINLVSKHPGPDASGEIIANTTSRNAQDLSAYLSSPLSGGWSGSVLSSFNRQTPQDLDDDDWIDMPGYDRFLIRPRLFYDGSDGARAYVTVGAMTEERRGGTVSHGVVPSLEPFQQNQDTRRFDVGFVGELPVADWGYAQLRASGMRQSHDHRFGNLLEKDEHETGLVEASLAGETSTSTWVGGVTYQADEYDPETFSAFNYSYETPAVFAQLEHDFSADISAALSARWDDHSEYGGQFSPRLSILYRPDVWTFRASWGRGFYAPTPFVEETEAAGLSRLEANAGLDAEIAETLSLDFGYSAGALELGLTLFGSNIEDAVRLQTASPNSVRLINLQGITRTRGVETLIRWRRAPYVITASYLYLDASEPDENLRDRRTLPLTPQNSLGLVAMWEQHDRGRVGLELYYTGKQSLQDNPYRNSSKPYLHIGLLGEIVLGRYRLFLNLENLLNVRQTREDTLLQPNRRPDGRWTVDAWSPLEGFIANAGVRVRLGR